MIIARDTARSFASYNRRANRELYDVLALLSERARHRPVGSWFGSIHGIANHLLVADLFWLIRFRPLAPDSAVLTRPDLAAIVPSWEHDLHETFEPMRETRCRVDDAICDWFDEFPADRYDAPFVYADSAGTKHDAVAGVAFNFLFVHQIHHRGQLSQVLDEIGLPNNVADNATFIGGRE